MAAFIPMLHDVASVLSLRHADDKAVEVFAKAGRELGLVGASK